MGFLGTPECLRRQFLQQERSVLTNRPNSGYKILYIVGRGRSGSTLLAHLLHAPPALINTGELKNFREYHLTMHDKDRHCADQVPLAKHPFWIRVRDFISQRLGDVLPDLKSDDQNAFEVNNNVIFDAIHEVSGAHVILDASKKYKRLVKLLRWRKEDIYVLHLVRDPRAYYFSTAKRTPRNTGSWIGLSRKIFEWNLKNLWLTIYLRLNAKHVRRLRYEDLCITKQEVLQSIYDFVGTKDSSHSDVEQGAHSPAFSGNVRFFRKEDKELQFDTTYLHKLTSWDWVKVTLLSIPSLWIYGYPLLRRAPQLTIRQA